MKLRSISGALLASAFISWLTIPSFSAEPPNIKANEILLGVPNVQSGPSGRSGKETLVGIRAMLDSVNADGGIHGKQLKILSCDDKYEPTQAVECFERLNSQGVFGLSGIFGSVCAIRYIQAAMIDKMPVVGLSPGTTVITDPPKRYVFATRPSYHDEAAQVVEKLWTEGGFRRFGLIYQGDAYGIDNMQGVKEALARHSAQITGVASYTRNQNTLSQMAKAVDDVKKSDPEVVILASVYKPCAEVAKISQKLHWHPIFVINSGSSPDLVVEEAGSLCEGWLFTEVVPPPSRSDLPLISRYQTAMRKFYPQEKLGFTNLRGYVDALVWVEGLKRAGKEPTREQFVAALEGIHDLDIGLGKGQELSYSKADHRGLHNVFFGTIKNGATTSFSDWKSLSHMSSAH